MTEQELDDAVEKLTSAITMLTARVDHRLMVMALFKLFSENIVHLEDKAYLTALADDFESIASDLRNRASDSTKTLN
jgi:hypothetical protein